MARKDFNAVPTREAGDIGRHLNESLVDFSLPAEAMAHGSLKLDLVAAQSDNVEHIGPLASQAYQQLRGRYTRASA